MIDESGQSSGFGVAMQPEDTIKKVANAILDAGEGCQSGLVYVDPFEAAKAAIAALSTHNAEPVKTAPAVAVKALRWKGPDSYGEYHSLDGLWGYIIRCEDDGHWLTEVGDYFRSPEAAQAAAQADYDTRIRAALSAQVQDVATAREFADRMFKLSGFMLSEEYRGKPAVTITFPDNAERNQFYSAIVDLSTHKTPAAPAAKLEGKP